VAGIAVGRSAAGLAGVGRAAGLIAIQVFSSFSAPAICASSPVPCALALTSDVVRGLEHVATLAGPGNITRIAAANLSLGGGGFTATCDTAPGMAAVKLAMDTLGGSSNVASVDLNSPARSVSTRALQPGTYYVRVRARNAFGVSPFSSELRFTVLASGPCSGPPAAPAGLTASVAGRNVALSWQVPRTSGLITAHIIEVGSSPGLTDLLSFNTGNAAGTFSAVAPPRTFFVRVRAVSACGPSAPSTEVSFTVP
jgi:hypothetical protein